MSCDRILGSECLSGAEEKASICVILKERRINNCRFSKVAITLRRDDSQQDRTVIDPAFLTRRLEAMGTAWRGHFELWPTERSGHATELARTAAERDVPLRQTSPYTPPVEIDDIADSLLVGGIGLRINAIAHALVGVLLGGLVVLGWSSGKYELEALPWMLLATLLLVLARGLWRRRNWSRVLALIIHWPVFVGAVSLLPLCLAYALLVTPEGIAVAYVFALYGVFLLSPIVLFSGSTVWYLCRRTNT